MISVVMLGLCLLVADAPKKPPARDAAVAVEPKLDTTEALAQYNEWKDKTPRTPAAQWKLAEWCERNGLEAEAFVHYTAVAQLDPKREAAWRKLGYKKHLGRWMTDEQIADEAVQLKADKEWKVRLKAIHRDIHGGRKQDEALTAVAEIESPRAIPAVYREFGEGGASDQIIATQILGQINTPLSSKVLALLAVYGKTPEIRRRATETLRGRDPDDYLAILVNLMADPLKYEVRPVAGPGSTGVLFVEGERLNLRRFYEAPAPFVRFHPGDMITYDANGLPIITRPFETLGSALIHVSGTKKTGTIQTYADLNVATRFSMTELLVEARKGAISAQLQLQADVQRIELQNDARKKFTDLVMTVAKDASGKNPGAEPRDWRDALAGKGQYQKDSKKTPRKPTIDELVPLAYLPRFGELTFVRGGHLSATPPDT